jgi:energy-coupling factor transporter transmembrane protein EcfT
VNRADDLALALQARGYERAKERSFYSHAKLAIAEIGFMVVTTLGLAALFLVTA